MKSFAKSLIQFGIASQLLLLCTGVHAQDIEQMMESKPVRFSGSVDMRAQFYSSQGNAYGYTPFNYVITGSPVLSLYGFQIPFSFMLGKQQSSFRQPFNRFGLSPTYKWITLHAGHRNLTYSPFTLAGHSFLGAGVDLRPGKFRISAMYGRFNRATLLDTALGFSVNNFTYKRKGWAVKAGYGSEKNYVELVVLHAKDDSTSLESTTKFAADSLGVAAAENFVTGLNTRFTLFDKITWETQLALSLYTNDLSAQGLDSLDIDGSWKNVAESLPISINVSSEYYTAVQSSVKYKSRFFSVKLKYQRIDPGYRSMGAYYLNNDLQNITINTSFVALKNKLRFRGSFGVQQDDLDGVKRASSKRIIGSANISAELNTHLGVDASFNNYSINQTVKALRLADSLKVVQNSMSLSIMPRYTYTTGKHSHTIMLNASLNSMKELNPARINMQTGDINTQMAFLTYQLGFLSNNLSLFTSINYTNNKSALFKSQNYGFTLGGSKSFFDNKLSLNLSNTLLMNKQNENKGIIINESLRASYRFFEKHHLHLSLLYNNNRPEMENDLFRQFSELRGEIGYKYSF